MTLQDYLTDVTYKVPTATTLSQTSLISAVNDARLEISSVCNIGLTILPVILTAGTNSYPYVVNSTLTQTGLRRIWVYLGNERYEIPRQPMGEYPLSGFQAYPAYYYLEGQSIYFYPIPSSDLTTDWEVVSIPTPLVNLADIEIYIPPIYLLPTKVLIASYVAVMDNKLKLSQVFRERYMTLVASFGKGAL